MDFSLSNEQRAWQMTARQFAEQEIKPISLALDEQPTYMLYWEKLTERFTAPHCSGKVMVCGHTAQKSGLPLDLGHAIGIDTFVYGSGWLTCLDVTSGHYWQANQKGWVREGDL